MKGYEYKKGHVVVVTDEDFAKARVEATQTFAIQAFVPARDIDYLYFDHPYYLAPSGKGGARAYALLRDALQKSERVGIGTTFCANANTRRPGAGWRGADHDQRFAHDPAAQHAGPSPASRYAKNELALATS